MRRESRMGCFCEHSLYWNFTISATRPRCSQLTGPWLSEVNI